MNKDNHLMVEMYRAIREQNLAGFSQMQQGVTPSLMKMHGAMQSASQGADNMKANKLMDELMQDMHIDAKYKGELIQLAMMLARKSAAAGNDQTNGAVTGSITK